MKVIKTRYDYIFLVYMPFLLAGFLLSTFFENQITAIFPNIMLFLLLCSLILAFTPYAKKTVIFQNNSKKNNRKFGILKTLLLQIVFNLIFLSLALQLFIVQKQPFPLIHLQNYFHYSRGGFIAWPFYIVVAVALNHFSQITQQPSSIRDGVHPVLKRISAGLIGYGIELFIKQGLMLITALFVVVNLIQLYQSISALTGLPALLQNIFQDLLVGGTLFCILTLPKTFSLIAKIPVKNHALKKMLLFYIVIALGLLVVLNFIFSPISTHFSEVLPSVLPLLNNRIFNINDSLLLIAALWMAWSPLIAFQLLKFSGGITVRFFILSNLIIPLISFGVWKIFMSNSETFLTTHLYSLMMNPIFSGLLGIIGLTTIILLFQDPETTGITHPLSLRKNIQNKTAYNWLIHIWQLSAAILVIYLIMQIKFLVLFANGVTLPIFLSSLITCVGAYKIKKQ